WILTAHQALERGVHLLCGERRATVRAHHLPRFMGQPLHVVRYLLCPLQKVLASALLLLDTPVAEPGAQEVDELAAGDATQEEPGAEPVKGAVGPAGHLVQQPRRRTREHV